jgi:hypothetical protein
MELLHFPCFLQYGKILCDPRVRYITAYLGDEMKSPYFVR